nr:PREDICTED: uncharacterized protein LOC107769761 [Nicotiana tabacum]
MKKAEYGLNGESAGGPDEFNCSFFHACWDIIGEDVMDMVKEFFNMQDLPKFVTHTNLVLLPKKKKVVTFSDMRPISLSFVKGRNIIENMLLTQEIITDMRLRTKAGPNAVIKLDMMKAYDRLS